MPLPGDLATTTVTGTATRADGSAAAGCVVAFAMPGWLVDTTSHQAVIPRVFTAVAASDGTWSVTVIATDQVQVSPLNWAYTFTINDGGQTYSASVQVPTSPDPTTFDVLVPIDTPGSVNLYVPLASKGQPLGVASLGSDGKVLTAQLPAGSGGGIATVTAADATITVGGTATDVTVKVASNAGLLATQLAGAVQTSLGKADSAYQKPGGGIPKADLAVAVQTSLGLADTALQSAPVTSVASKTGAVTLVKGDVGLDNVDNTSDVNKPVSTAQNTAISAKYTLPGSGVPKTDLAAAVQTSLGLADTALQLAPAPDYAAAYSCHVANVDPFMCRDNSTINEQWFMRLLVRAGRQINLVKTFVRTVGTAGAGGLNGFALYDDGFTTLLWNSVSDDTMWTAAAGEVSKSVTGSLTGLTNRTPTVDTWFRVGISARGHTAAPNFPFANFGGTSALTDAGSYRCRYRASAYSAWPASIVPATDLTGVSGFVPPVLIG